MTTFCRNFIALLIFLILAACTPTLYGVPVEQWEKLNDDQKLETIKGYNERRILQQQEYMRAQAARVEAARVAQAAAAQAASAAPEYSEAYRDEVLRYGDLLRIVLKNGTLRFSGKQRAYDLVTFTIASGETLHIPVRSGSSRQATLVVNYFDGVLSLDPKTQQGLQEATRFVYEPDWKRGKTYTPLNSRGPSRLSGASLYVEIIPVETKHRR